MMISWSWFPLFKPDELLMSLRMGGFRSWYLLGVLFKVSDELPHPFYIGVRPPTPPPPSPGPRTVLAKCYFRSRSNPALSPTWLDFILLSPFLLYYTYGITPGCYVTPRSHATYVWAIPLKTRFNFFLLTPASLNFLSISRG